MTFVCAIAIFFSIYPWYLVAIVGFCTSCSEEKLSFNLIPAVKYFSAAVTAQCPRHIFGGNSHGPNDFRFLLSYSYKSCYVFVEKIRHIVFMLNFIDV